MIYENMVKATFIKRPNRFIAHCIVNGKEDVDTAVEKMSESINKSIKEYNTVNN